MTNGIQKQYKNNVEKQINESGKGDNEALSKAKGALGEAEGTELYNKIHAAEKGKSILANKRYLYATGIDNHRKEVDRLGEKGLSLSKEYKGKKEQISNNPDLTDSGKSKQIDGLYQDYHARVKSIIDQQTKLRVDHENEYSKIAAETLTEIEEEASIGDFSDTDMQYIMYILQHGSNDFLFQMLEEYDFNPFLIKMVNARDSKKPSRIVDPGSNSSKQNPDKLTIEHPLKGLTNGSGFVPNNLQTKTGAWNLHDLVPTKGVPSVDPWAQMVKK